MPRGGQFNADDEGYRIHPDGEFGRVTMLQRVYEAIPDRGLDTRSFRKKVLRFGVLEPGTRSPEAGAARCSEGGAE